MTKIGWVAGLTVLAALVIAASISRRLGQMKEGFCPTTGVQLSEEDLRQKVLSSLLDIGLENIRVQDVDHSRGGRGLKVAGSISDRETAKALLDLKSSGADFGGEFGARKVTSGYGGRADVPPEPFVLLNYSTYGGYTATRTASRDIMPVSYSTFPATVERPGLWRRLRGFGVHYSRIPIQQFIYDCCAYREGIQAHAEAPVSLPHFHESGKDGSVIIGSHDMGGVAYVSNCGEILTRRNARGFNQIVWIK